MRSEEVRSGFLSPRGNPRAFSFLAPDFSLGFPRLKPRVIYADSNL